MLFNSFDFAIYLPIVFALYWLLKKHLKWQNLLVVIASYVFYGWWDWRFLSLIFISTCIDYFVGLQIEKTSLLSKKKKLLWVSMVANLGFLGFFKYFNFFIDNFTAVFQFLGYSFKYEHLNIVLPVGISFYTFQTMSYTIDVYRGKLKPTKDFIAFSAFVSFFPQLVAGPIERATHLLPQFYKEKEFDYEKAVDGMRQILWGLFKKIVIADQSAVFVNEIFKNYTDYNGSSLFFGAFFFALQIYSDFSGYSDIAIGVSKLFGIELMQNFAFPYFSRDIAEFWRRWHISLSTWFKDYLYIPLGGSRGSKWLQIRNTFVIFLVSGFWHGANWTFIAWGFLNACYFLPLLLLGKNRNNMEIVAKGKLLPTFKEIISIAITFSLTLFAWIFFRAETLSHAFDYINHIFVESLFAKPDFLKLFPKAFIFPLLIFFVAEWLGKEKQYALQNFLVHQRRVFRWSFYLIIIFFIGLFTKPDTTDFIYFQF